MITKLMADLKTAMKEKDVPRKEAIQMLIGRAKSIAKETLADVNDTHVLTAVQKELKETKEAFEMMKDKMDEAKKVIYQKKIAVYESYLPKQMSETDIKAEIEKTFAGLGLPKEMKSMSALMKVLSAKFTGYVDNSLMSKLIKDFLSK